MPTKTHLSLGNEAFRQGDYPRAIAHYEQALHDSAFVRRLVEPNLRLARAKLDAASARSAQASDAEVVPRGSRTPEALPIAVAVHAFYPDLFEDMLARLERLDTPFGLFISTVPEHRAQVERACARRFPDARIVVLPNRGLDIQPFLVLLPMIRTAGYPVVCKLRTKRGQGAMGAAWCNLMLDALIGSREGFAAVATAFARTPDLVMVGPAGTYQSTRRLMLDNRPRLEHLHQILWGQLLNHEDWGFFCGTQFWARVSLFETLVASRERLEADFSNDYRQDGGAEHALERLFGLLPVRDHQRIGLLHRGRDGHYDRLQLAQPLDAIGAATIREFSTRAANLAADKQTILDARVFDADHYTQTLPPDLRAAGIDPLEHYLLIGNFQGLMPSPHFSPAEYRALHGDVAKALEEPLLHYLRIGAQEGRRLWRDPTLEDLHAGFRFQVLGAQTAHWDHFDPTRRDPGLVSIIIPVHGQHTLLTQCVDSLHRTRTRQRFEIVLVDNYKDDSTTQALRALAARYPTISLVENSINLNFALGCNLGFLRATGATIVFLNSDTEVTDGWLDALIAPLADPTIVAVQPKLIYPNGRIQTIGSAASPLGDLPHHLYTGEPASAAHVNYGRPFTMITAACMALRAEDFAQVKGFNPLYLNGWEDVDLCLKLTADRRRHCWYTPDATVIHHEGQSEGRNRYVEVNRRTFLSRWQGKVPREALAYYELDGFQVIDWTVDNPQRLAMGIALHKPILNKL